MKVEKNQNYTERKCGKLENNEKKYWKFLKSKKQGNCKERKKVGKREIIKITYLVGCQNYALNPKYNPQQFF